MRYCLPIVCGLLVLFGLFPSASAQISRVEYYIDHDPGYGSAVSIPLSPGNTNINAMVSIDPSVLSSGIHRFVVRAQDASGAWGLQESKLFFVPFQTSGSGLTPLSPITKIEYYLDHDPGLGNANSVAFTPGVDVSQLVIPIDPTMLSSGIHRFVVRAQDASGAWSLQESKLFFVPFQTSGSGLTPLSPITKIEYYLDQDPGLGNANSVAFTPGVDVSQLVIPIDPTMLSSGIHRFVVRAQDAAGAWSLQESKLFFVPFQTSGFASVLPNLGRIEYYVDNDPGYGSATAVPFTPGSNASNLVISLNPADYAIGPHHVVVRAQDAQGNWSLNNRDTFRVFANAIATNPLSLTGFNADVIAELSYDAVGSTNNDVDNSGNVWMAESFNPLGTSWLPDNGFVSSYYEPGVDFQLQPYNQNNTLKLQAWQTDSLMLMSPVASDSFYVLGSSGGGTSFSVKMVFVDSSEYTFNGLNMGNWYNPSYFGPTAVSGLGWCYKWNNSIYNHPTETRMYSTKLVVPASHQGGPLHHLVFQNQSWSPLHVLAVSSVGSCAGLLNPGATLASATSICPGTLVTLSVQNPIQSSGISYQWQLADDSAFTQNVQALGNAATQSVQPSQATYYRCQISCAGGMQVFSDPLLIDMLPVPVNPISADTVYACSDSIWIEAAAGLTTYTWNTGANSMGIFAHHSGWYSVQVSNGSGCQQVDSIFVMLLPNQIQYTSDSICQGESITLSIGAPTSMSGYYGPYAYNGHVYFISQSSMNWSDANNQAILSGGHLVTVNSAAENAFLTTTAQSLGFGAIWLGGSDAAIEGTWQWVDAAPWSYANWNWAEPNNLGNEDYLELVVAYGGWNDLAGSTAIPYAVEFDWNNTSVATLWSTADSSVSIMLAPNVSSTYWVSTTYLNTTCSDTLPVFVSPVPVTHVTASSQLICSGDSVTFTATGADTYQWSDGQVGNPVLVSPIANTTYTVVGSNAFGCSNTATYSVDVHLTSSSTSQATACGSYTWNGLTYDSTNCQGGIQAFDGSNHYYRYATIYDWDCCLFSAGVMEGPSYPVDGHIKIEYNCNGVGTVIESTGGYASSYPVGSSYGSNFGYASNPTFLSLAANSGCCNASGNLVYVALSAERVTPSFDLHFTNASGCDSVASLQLTFSNSALYFADNDNDGYGDINQSVVLCTPSAGYVQMAGDCDDNDSSEHPNQVWYTDYDHDLYGTGNYLLQCTRPVDAYLISELLATVGDCNDYDASIRPGVQYFVLSNTTSFPNVLVSPQSGDATTNFQFEVTYVDSNNALPAPGFPRIILDYEGNGYYNNTNDRTLVMQPYDVNDLNTADGKKYIASTSNLAYGLNYEVLVQNNNAGCITQAGPFLYPDVLQKPDLEIFANDITFSTPNPPVSSLLTVSAVVHNESNQVAQNFWVHLRNQYDTSIVYPDIFVNAVAPYGSTTVNWQITTPTLPAWCPMEVSVDYTQQVQETNELDNTAIRPFVNGNFNLPGGIHVYPFASPVVQYASPGAVVNIGGFAAYYGTAVPLVDSSVAGATVTFTLLETGATYSGYTNSFGNFLIPLTPPPIPGTYHVSGTVTDFTLTGNFTDSFTLIPYVSTICNLPDLSLNTNPSSIIVAGGTINGVMHVSNYGNASSQASWLDISNTGGVPNLSGVAIPALTAGASHDVPYSVTFPTPGNYSICGFVDPSNTEAECAEYNNQYCHYITVLPAQPDIVPYYGPSGNSWICNTNGASFSLLNQGAGPTGPFDCEIEIWFNGSMISTQTHSVSNIYGVLTGNNTYSFSIPFTPVLSGQYEFHIKADLPQNAILETNELNNEAIYILNLSVCKPDLVAGTCEEFNVESPNTSYTPGSNITLKGRVYNSGNLAYIGSLQVHWILSGGTTYTSNINVNLAPGTSVAVSHVITAPVPATQTLTMTIDPMGAIDELNETNNSITNAMCWDFSLADLCGYNFWSSTVQQYSTMYLSIGVVNPDLYDADTLRVKFQVSGPGISGTLDLGNAYVYNVGQTCYCPVAATLPASFAFQQTGVYTFTMTVDPNNQYSECDETNNVLVRQVTVSDLPDMRVLSQYIAPSLLNPAVNQALSLNVTYENIGRSNLNDQMSLQVLVDNNLHQTINGLSGLITGIDTTIAISSPIASNVVGIHVIRAIIDAGNQVLESDEYNNEATRSFIVGDAANLYFSSFKTLTLNPALGTNVNIRGKIANGGDLPCEADVKFYYVNNNLDTIYIGTQHVNVAAHDSVNATQTWMVADAQTTLIGKIVNSTQLEYTYDDNSSNYPIGQMLVMCTTTPACAPSMIGSITATVLGGEPPYYIVWNNGWVGDTLTDSTGNYTVVVTDATGQSVTASAFIPMCPQALLHTRFYLEGYYLSNGEMTPAMYNQGLPALNSYVDTVIVELHENGNGYGLVESAQGILHTNGMLDVYFSSAVTGHSYYIAIRHRNTVYTWSSNPVPLSTNANYDFSTAVSQAYGNNMKAMDSGYYAFYSGDINQDENIDLLDLAQIETDIVNFEDGYQAADLNGDGNVDLLDSPILEVNRANFIYSIHP